MSGVCTIYKSFSETDKPYYKTIEEALNRIRTGKSKEMVEKVRKEEIAKEQRKLKSKLPCICFSGKFTHREDASITEHSGFVILDFDKLKDLKSRLVELKADNFIYACWISPSGKGIKALVKIPPDIASHREYFMSLMVRFPDMDKTNINISRICYESYDPDVYVNENSEIWSEKKIEKKELKPIQNKIHDYKIVNIAAQMIRNSIDGSKHEVLLKAAKLIGGYIAVGKIDEFQAIQALEYEINNKNIDDKASAIQTIKDGIEYGKSQPISEAIKIEREARYIKNEQGQYNFLACEAEMDKNLYDIYHGKKEPAKSTKIYGLDYYYLLKRNTFSLFIGIDNVGKSVVLWYIAVVAAVYHDWKFLIYSGENDDEQIKIKILEFFNCRSFKNLTDSDLKNGNEFYKKHFKIISSKVDVYSCVQLLEMAQVVYEEQGAFDVFILEPYNSFKMDTSLKMTSHEYNYFCLSEIRLFTKRYCSTWIAAHTISEAARNLDTDGNCKVPLKSQVEGGQPFCNRADDIIILHRKTKSKDLYRITEIHIDKVKNQDTGGRPTPYTEPIKIRMTEGNCGFEDSELPEQNPILKYYAGETSDIQPAKSFYEPNEIEIEPTEAPF